MKPNLEANRLFPPINVPQNKALGIENFILTYLRRHWCSKTTGKIIKPAKFHRDLYYFVSNPEKYPLAILVAPRGFSKSVVTMFFGPLYHALVTRKYEEILLVGASQDLADKWLGKIKHELTNNEKILRDFGELSTDGMNGGKWATDEIKLANGITIYSRGRGSKVRGLHPQYIVIDDIEGDEGALSQTECEKIDRWIKAAIIPMQLEEGAVLHWDGTFLAPDSVLHKAYHGRSEGFGEEWFRYKREAFNKDGKSVWPERFSESWLETKRRILGTSIFAAEYMNEPISSLNPMVRREWIRFYENAEVPKFMYKVLAIDPAISERETADKTAMCVIGGDNTTDNPSEKYFVLDADQGHWDINSTVRRMFEFYRIYAPDIVIVETVGYQKALVQTIEREARDRGIYLPIEERIPDRDKGRRLKAVSPMIEAGNVVFRNTQDELIDQLVKFPGSAHDDLMDAFVYALTEFKDYWAYVQEETQKNTYEEKTEHAIPQLAY